MRHGVRKILVKVECFDTWKFNRLHFLFFSTTYPCCVLHLQIQSLLRTASHKSQSRIECNITIPKQRHDIYLTFISPCVIIYSYSKTNQMHLFLKLFILVKQSTYFGRSFCPSRGAQDCTYSNRHMSNGCCYLLLAAAVAVCTVLSS
jgi:hypothetical protein